MIHLNKYLVDLDQLKTAINEIHPELIMKNFTSISTRIAWDHMFLWWLNKDCNNLTEKFPFIHRIQQILQLWITIYYSLYRNLLMKMFQFLGRLQKAIAVIFFWGQKGFSQMELWNWLKDGIRKCNKMVNMLFNKVNV